MVLCFGISHQQIRPDINNSLTQQVLLEQPVLLYYILIIYLGPYVLICTHKVKV